MSKPVSVVIAEDHLVQQKLLVRLAGELGLHVVEAVSNGKTMIEVCLRRRPDIVMVDIHLSELSGVEACKEINRHGYYPHIIFISSSVIPQDEKAALANVAAYLTKPVDFNDLVSVILGTKNKLTQPNHGLNRR